MKIFRVFWLGLLLAASALPLAAQNVAIYQQDYAMEMYFRFFLADCRPDEIRCVWFPNNDLQIGWRMIIDLRTGSVETVRDTHDAARVNKHPSPGELNVDKIAALRQILTALPPTQEAFPMRQCVLVAHHVGVPVQITQYNRVNPPPIVQQLYDLGDGYISLGEADLRDMIGLTADETEKLAGFSRPWSVSRVLDWYRQAKNADDRKFWAHVLAVSGDPRAALALEKNLGQGDASTDLRDLASYFFDKSSVKNQQTLADAQKWFAANHPRLEAQAAILSGQPPPALPAADPNCPEVIYHENPGSHAAYDEATVTLDRAGLARIVLKRTVSVERDFQLSAELIVALRKLLTDNKFFTAAEPPASSTPYPSTAELSISADGQKRTIHQTWAPDFYPVRLYFSQLVFLTSSSMDPRLLSSPASASP